MNIRKLEDLSKEELIEIIRHERDHFVGLRKMVNGNAPAINKTSDSVLNAKYADGYVSGYVVACNFAASLASEAWVNHVFHTGLDGLIERCKNMEQVLLEKAQACRDCVPASTAVNDCLTVEPTDETHVAALQPQYEIQFQVWRSTDSCMEFWSWDEADQYDYDQAKPENRRIIQIVKEG